jgi:ribosomal protein S13
MYFFKYKDVIMPEKGSVLYSLIRVQGLGVARAEAILASLGMAQGFNMAEMNYYKVARFIILLKYCFILDARLKEIMLQRLEFFYSKGFIKGIRIFDGLPVKGRTHSNGASAERMKPHSEKYNEEIVQRRRRISAYSKKKRKK